MVVEDLMEVIYT